MSQDIIHVCLMPGMAANPSIFDNIKLPVDVFEIHYLNWVLPFKNETIEDYANRMLTKVGHDNSVLIGVSFGGILVQEMSKIRAFKKVIIISSVKTKFELPRRMKFTRVAQLYRLTPTRLAKNVNSLAKYAFGKTVKRRVDLFKKYLSVDDKSYLDWALKQMVCWEQKDILPEIIHIHGTNDMVFPIKNIRNCVQVKRGTHIMIINKYRWFNANLPKLILS